MKHLEKYERFVNEINSAGERLKDIMSRKDDKLKLNVRQKIKILRNGLETNYRVFGNSLQFTTIGQMPRFYNGMRGTGGSELAHIEERGGKYYTFLSLSNNGIESDDLDSAIDIVINHKNR